MAFATRYRVVVLALLAVAVVLLANGYTAYGGTTIGRSERAIGTPMAEREPVVPPAEGPTVVTARGFEDHDRSAAIVAFASDGRPTYFDNTLDVYWDVEPVAGRADVVVYTGRLERGDETVNVLERVDLRTGEVERLYAATGPGAWQSLAVVDEHHVVVGDADQGRAFVVDTVHGAVEWEWFAHTYVDADGAVRTQRTVARLNDVATTPDGRVIVNLHVLDQALFVRPGHGVEAEWTVGRLMNHERLYHQHDVDYVPAASGGPSTVFADAGNDRLVEYHRDDGRWVQTWTWTVPRLDAPADADRLSGGRTIVANAGGDEVFVVSRSGAITWRMSVPHPTDVERLGPAANASRGGMAGQGGVGVAGGTGNETAGPAWNGTASPHVGINGSRDGLVTARPPGPPLSAVAAGIESRREPRPPWQLPLGHYLDVGLGLVALDGVADAVLPAWVDDDDLPPLALLLASLGGWLLLEAWRYRRRPGTSGDGERRLDED